jgi:hypothetical protein
MLGVRYELFEQNRIGEIMGIAADLCVHEYGHGRSITEFGQLLGETPVTLRPSGQVDDVRTVRSWADGHERGARS